MLSCYHFSGESDDCGIVTGKSFAPIITSEANIQAMQACCVLTHFISRAMQCSISHAREYQRTAADYILSVSVSIAEIFCTYCERNCVDGQRLE